MNSDRRARIAACLGLLVSLPGWCVNPPVTWFCPPDPPIGNTEYMNLFTPDAPWPKATSHVQVFKIYPVWTMDAATGAQLQQQLSDLKRRGFLLALEFPLLNSPVCGNVEGILGLTDDQMYATVTNAANRIKSNGGDLRYVAMDHPFDAAVLTPGPVPCGWTAEQVAKNALQNFKAFQAVFPEVTVGTIETPRLPFLSRHEEFMDAWRKVAGFPLAFFHSDVDWSDFWSTRSMAVLRQAATARGIPFGVIYDGNNDEQTDADWLNHAQDHFVLYEQAASSPPDHAIFQSWYSHPAHLLPETDTASFTNLIDRYARPRTHITLGRAPPQAAGVLSDDQGGAVAGVPVTLSASSERGNGLLGDYTVSGTVPQSAKVAVVGLRVNMECQCSGVSEFFVNEFHYAESGPAGVTKDLDFWNGLNGWGLSNTDAAQVESTTDPPGKALHVSATPVQSVLLNSAGFPITPGAAYTFHVSARVAPQSLGSGYFTIIFLNDTQEVDRQYLNFQTAAVSLGSPVTGADGSFQLTVPDLGTDPVQLQASFAGTDAFWPASATLSWAAGPVISSGGVRNAASLATGSVAPGEIVTIFGFGMGPAALAPLQLTADGRVGTLLSGTRVLFDGVATPLIYSQGGQVAAVAPFGLAGKTTTQVSVEYQGAGSAAETMSVAASAPAIFTVNANGVGQGAIRNHDLSLNTGLNPAPRGSIVMLWATGGGLTSPPSADGVISGSAPSKLLLPVSVTIAGVPAEVIYAGPAPGLVAGAIQVNARVPLNLTPAVDIPIQLRVGDAVSPPGVTMAVQ